MAVGCIQSKVLTNLLFEFSQKQTVRVRTLGDHLEDKVSSKCFLIYDLQHDTIVLSLSATLKSSFH